MSSDPRRDAAGRTALVLGGVAAAALGLGGLTSIGQGALPEALQSFANSASGWTLLTAVLVGVLHRTSRLSAVLGAVAFVLLVLGYALVSTARGHPFSPDFWAPVGVVVGPFVGVAAAWLRTRDRRAALGAGLLAGIGLGDAVWGLTVVAEHTSPVYWTLIGLVAVGLLVVVGLRLRRAGPIVLEAGIAVGVAALQVAAYSVLS